MKSLFSIVGFIFLVSPSIVFATEIVDVHPDEGSHTAPINSILEIFLDDLVNGDSINTDTMVVHGGFQSLQNGDFQVTEISFTYDPLNDFFPGELIQTSVTSGIYNQNGDPIEPYVWEFRAGVDAEGTGSYVFVQGIGNFSGNFSTSTILLGDLDGDGDLDTFFTYRDSDNSEVWFNDGTGKFFNSGQKIRTPSADFASLGDLDRDGDLDVFVGGHSCTESIWLNDGSGMFTDSGHELCYNALSSVDLGDLDGDGDLDAFFSCVGNMGPGCLSNLVWFNDGNGIFVDSGQTWDNIGSTSVALGDLDKDGDLDAFVTNGFNSTTTDSNMVLFNDGSGVFTDSGQLLGSSDSEDVSLGDLDGDGDLDVFIANYYSDKIWLNNGNGQFSDSGQNLGTSRTWSCVLADLDADGDLDAVVSGNKGLYRIWQNNGEGIFTLCDAIIKGSDAAIGDLDGDGDLDAIVRNFRCGNSVWLNQTMTKLVDVFPDEGSHNVESDMFYEVSVDLDAGVDSGSIGENTLIVHGSFHGYMEGKIEGNSKHFTYDLATNLAPGEHVQATIQDIYVYQSDSLIKGSYVWQFNSIVKSGSGTFFRNNQLLGNSDSNAVALGDLDGDGDLDAFIANNYEAPNTVWLNDGAANFVSNGQALGNSNSFFVALGDLDNDGDLDAFVANSVYTDDDNYDDYSEVTYSHLQQQHRSRVWINNGSGLFTESGQVLNYSNSRSVALGDLDGDGNLDAFLVNGDGNLGISLADTVLLNNGSGVLVESDQELFCGDETRGYGVSLGDIDNDGDLDAVVSEEDIYGSHSCVWINNGKASFYADQFIAGFLQSALGDIDDDGDLDLVVARNSGDLLFLNDGFGRFTESGSNPGIFCSSVALGDLDADGDLDVFFTNASPSYGEGLDKVWLNNGNCNFSDNGQILGTSSDSAGIALGDLDGDGDLDAFSANLNGGNTVWINKAGTDIDTDTDTDTETSDDTDTNNDTDTDTDTHTNTDTDTDIDTETSEDIDTDTDTNMDSDTDKNNDTDTDSDSDSGADSNNKSAFNGGHGCGCNSTGYRASMSLVWIWMLVGN